MQEKNRETSKYFRNAMKILGFNQSEMASQLGISRPHACNIAKGNRGITGKLMIKIERMKNLAIK